MISLGGDPPPTCDALHSSPPTQIHHLPQPPQESHSSGAKAIGFDTNSGEPMDSQEVGIWDNYCVKRQMLDSAAIISAQLLLVDEVIRAGKQMKKG